MMVGWLENARDEDMVVIGLKLAIDHQGRRLEEGKPPRYVDSRGVER